jgi:hypothetical protein
MTGGPTSASAGSPLGRRSFIPGTPRFVRFISLLGGGAPRGGYFGATLHSALMEWTPP